MNLSKELKHETVEKLSELRQDKNWKELVRILRLTQDKYAKLCLTRNTWDEIQKLQYKAVGISIVIKTVEESYNKLNKGDEKDANK